MFAVTIHIEYDAIIRMTTNYCYIAKFLREFTNYYIVGVAAVPSCVASSSRRVALLNAGAMKISFFFFHSLR